MNLTIFNKREEFLLFVCWLLATVSMLGSLFFSEVMLFPPCVLCWYQRIAMYPLVFLFLVGVFHPPQYAVFFSAPLVVIGWATALYHNLLHYGIVPESATPCREGLSCATVFINWLGFITIPMLSFISFSLIMILLIALYRSYHREK